MNTANFYDHLRTYADLIVSVGLNLQTGEKVKINFDMESLPLVRIIAETAYKRGASTVFLNFRDSKIDASRDNFLHEKFVDTFPTTEAENLLNLQLAGYSEITILTPFLQVDSVVDPDRVARLRRAKSMAMRPVRQYGMENHNKWVVVNYVTKEWAQLIYPGLDEEAAVTKLWEVIFQVTRVFEDDPVTAWELHDRQLKDVQNRLNLKKFDRLQFIGGETHLRVGLVRDHIWVGGSELTIGGEKFMSNMPVEEIWTMPDKRRIDGYFTMTKPLTIGGTIVHKLQIHFEQGKIVKLISDQHDVVKDLLQIDEGASMLGEVALVPAGSPIDQAGVCFYNTLLDENAASHIAFGQAYLNNMKNGFGFDEDELDQLGMNHSSVHQDIMIGGSGVDVIGIHADGSEEIILRKGAWVI